MDDRPRTRPYARIERERRFLLERLPSFVDPEVYERLTDRYVAGTRLRLRRITTPEGEAIQLKLGQKLPDPAHPGSPGFHTMTTIYLDVAEGAALECLAGERSVKRRHYVVEQGWTFAIDVWEEPESAAGVIVAEVECGTDEELAAVRMPEWAVREVTEDVGYSGARLAGGARP